MPKYTLQITTPFANKPIEGTIVANTVTDIIANGLKMKIWKHVPKSEKVEGYELPIRYTKRVLVGEVQMPMPKEE